MSAHDDTSEAARTRAEDVRRLPHVKSWIKRFEKLAAEMPPEVWIFCESGKPYVMTLDAKRKPYEVERSGRTDTEAIVASIDGGPGTEAAGEQLFHSRRIVARAHEWDLAPDGLRRERPVLARDA